MEGTRAIGGWQFAVMRPRMADYILSMPRGAQIMYPKDIAQVLELGDIRAGARVLESGAGSGAMSLHLLDAVTDRGSLTTIELRPDFARVAEANATLYYGFRPQWWTLEWGISIPSQPRCPNIITTASCSTCSIRGIVWNRRIA